MAAVLRSVRCCSKSTLFSISSLQYRNVKLLPKTAQRTTVIAAAFHSCFYNQRNGFQERKSSKLTSSSCIPSSVTANSISTTAPLDKYYVKPNYLKKWGRRDMKKREMFKDYEVERSGLRMIKKSDILPSGVRQKAAEDLGKLPLNSSLTRIRNRCVLTDRGRGIVGRFRVSRMMFRYFAEKGLISGVQKAQW